MSELQAGSVQIWQTRADEWATSDIPALPGVKQWTLPYDAFLGYMAGVLPLVEVVDWRSLCNLLKAMCGPPRQTIMTEEVPRE